MSTNQELYDAAQEAITRLFSDMSVPQSKTRENLNSLIGEIEVMLDTLKDGDDD